MNPTPSPELVAALRRIRGTIVVADHQEPPAKDPLVRILHSARLVRWHQAPTIRGSDGSFPPDRGVITDDGTAWLAEHDKEQ